MRSRTPPHYKGTASTNQQMGSVLNAVVKKLQKNITNKSGLIFTLWPGIIGEQLAPMTQVVSYQEGVLIVKVKNSTLLSLLSQRDKPRILRKLREMLPHTEFNNVIFKIG